jgi:hypothetical protein
MSSRGRPVVLTTQRRGEYHVTIKNHDLCGSAGRLLLLVIGRPHAVDRGELIRVLFDQK